MSTNPTHVLTQHLSEALARETDNLIREAINRFFGHKDWLLGDLKGRAVMTILPSRNEVFSVDGVPLLEIQPVDLNLNSTTIAANRKYRFLVGNVEIDAALGGLSDVIGRMLQERGREDASAALLERIYLAMEQAAPPPQTPFDTCPTCEALARTVMMDQTGAA